MAKGPALMASGGGTPGGTQYVTYLPVRGENAAIHHER